MEMIDRKKLVADVKELAILNNLSMRDCWEYIYKRKSTPEWMRIIAEQEIIKEIDNINSFLEFLNK